MLPDVSRLLRCGAWVMLSALAGGMAHAKDWTVAVHVHEVTALTNSDAIAPFGSSSQAQDMYRRITIEPVVGTGAAASCDNEDNVDVNENHVTPGDWGCTMKVSGKFSSITST